MCAVWMMCVDAVSKLSVRFLLRPMSKMYLELWEKMFARMCYLQCTVVQNGDLGGNMHTKLAQEAININTLNLHQKMIVWAGKKIPYSFHLSLLWKM